jgi:hypothetical protein
MGRGHIQVNAECRFPRSAVDPKICGPECEVGNDLVLFICQHERYHIIGPVWVLIKKPLEPLLTLFYGRRDPNLFIEILKCGFI